MCGELHNEFTLVQRICSSVPTREKLEGFGAYLKTLVKKIAPVVLGTRPSASGQSLLSKRRRVKKAPLNERIFNKYEVSCLLKYRQMKFGFMTEIL